MKPTIFLKMFTGYALIAVVLSGLILAFSFTWIRNFYVESAARDLKNLATALETSAIPLVLGKKYHDLDGLAKKVGKEINTRITFIAPDGRVLADSEADPAAMENHRTRTEVAQALEGKTGRFLRQSDTLKEEMLYVALPVTQGGKVVAVVRLSLFLKAMNTALSRITGQILLITFIILGLSLFGALLFSRRLTKPIRQLGAASRKVANQDFNVRVLLKSRDELKDLADNFNSMVAQIRNLFAELTHQKEELTSIISSLQEGLLVLDRDDRVLLYNESFRGLTDEGIGIGGKYYWEIFREPRFDELVRKVRRNRVNRMEEIEFGKRIFLCSATLLKSEEEIALVFHDITQTKILERVKTDFVLNVSHELRTPLTAIKGFAEALEESARDEETRHYVEIISRNTNRLIHIINDLLTISRLEAKDVELDFSAVDLKELTANVIKIFVTRIEEKNLYLRLSAEEDLPVIEGDPFRLEQMLINLIDNGVKYSETGGIDISLAKRAGKVAIVVKDTGIGIPREHLSRIFERFYVVDKSRSKKMGGTGLGLSIVKHVVMLHKGSIEVESIMGKGTVFTILLPLPRTA
ncbi:MAG TPA: ATP-binding protein [Syntrophorhabdaceae bacterium]